jgi:NADH:ubiquinone oxidoreductase subunit 2 (subunit N)
MSWSDLGTIAPVVASVLVAAAILIVDLALPNRRQAVIATALGGLGVVAAVVLLQAGHTGSAFGGAYSLDNLTVFLDAIFVAIAVLTILFGVDYIEPRGLPIAEFAAILVFAVTGAMLIAGSTDLVLLFVALELMVLPGYVLASPGATHIRPRVRSSTSCWARSRARSCSSAWRTCGASPGPPVSRA